MQTEKKPNKLEEKRRKAQEQIQNSKKSSWNVGQNYNVKELIGKGAYSMVAMGVHIPSGRKVAIKRVVDLFVKKHEALRILRQVVLLRMLEHKNIIRLYEIVVPDTTKFSEIYLILEYFPKDIKKLLRSNIHLTQEEIAHITYRIIVALKYLGSAMVLHRDLKPENVLINEYFQVKLCDFGLARPVAVEDKQQNQNGVSMQIEGDTKTKIDLSGHVTTRWYRAPELILLQRNYNSAIDMWSVGCIFGELLNMMKENAAAYVDRSPLFPGKACYPLSPPRGQEKVPYKNINDFPHSSQDQLDKIFQIIGTPEEKDYEFITDQKAIKYIKSFAHKQKKNFRTIFKCLTPESEDFLERTLIFNPLKRITIDEAVEHPLFKQVRNIQVEMETKPITIELDNLSIEQIRDLFLKEIEYYKINKPKFE